MLDVGHMFDSVIIVWVFVVFFSLAYIGVGSLQIQIHVRVQRGQKEEKKIIYIAITQRSVHHMPQTMPIFVQSILCEMMTVETSR